MTWLAAICSNPPPGGKPIIWTIDEGTNRHSYLRFLKVLEKDIKKHQDDQRVVLVYDGK
jgi:hypothetical protein